MCVRCGTPNGVYPFRSFVSGRFTDLTRMKFPTGRGFCYPCGILFKNPIFRQQPFLITQSQTSNTYQHIYQMLGHTLTKDTAASVPLSGRKHVLPFTQWGAVSFDGEVLPWEDTYSVRWRMFQSLTDSGVNVSNIALNTSPPAQVVKDRRLSMLWRTVTKERSEPWFNLAIHVKQQTLKEIGGTL